MAKAAHSGLFGCRLRLAQLWVCRECKRLSAWLDMGRWMTVLVGATCASCFGIIFAALMGNNLGIILLGWAVSFIIGGGFTSCLCRVSGDLVTNEERYDAERQRFAQLAAAKREYRIQRTAEKKAVRQFLAECAAEKKAARRRAEEEERQRQLEHERLEHEATQANPKPQTKTDESVPAENRYATREKGKRISNRSAECWYCRQAINANCIQCPYCRVLC